MNKYLNSIAQFILACGVLVLSACGHIRGDAPEFSNRQMMANVQAAVIFDEMYSSFALSNHDRYAGVGMEELKYRRILVKVYNSQGGRPLWGFSGSRAFEAAVPDGFPLLKAGDLVEVRATTWFDYLQNFDKSRDGSAVLRIICPTTEKGNSEQMRKLKACASNLPWNSDWGEENRYFYGVLSSSSGREFLPRLSDYPELKFSPFYDELGNPLKSAVPPGERPHY